jgi:hypothetical protein
MRSGAKSKYIHHWVAPILISIALLICLTSSSFSADTNNTTAAAVQVQLNAKKGGPREVEALTERGILRDYRSAWTSMTQALAFNTSDPLEGPFTGPAKQWLQGTVTNQQKTGLSQRYLDQKHNLEAVFYAPEGDVIELHDTAEYQRQVLDGNNTIDDERVVAHYIVLMTPGADRWVIRQLQAVPTF